MDVQDYYTIKEVASMLKVSDKTVRRRIQSKQLKAIMQDGAYGMQYYLPKEQFDNAVETIEVLTVKKEHEVRDLALFLNTYLEARDNKLLEEIKQLKEEHEKSIEDLKKQLEDREEMIIERTVEQINKQRTIENDKLIDYIEKTREQHRVKIQEMNKPWWQKVLKRNVNR